MRNEGIAAFSKGFGPAMLRAFPANAVSLLLISIIQLLISYNIGLFSWL